MYQPFKTIKSVGIIIFPSTVVLFVCILKTILIWFASTAPT